jgi:hypothetical protein
MHVVTTSCIHSILRDTGKNLYITKFGDNNSLAMLNFGFGEILLKSTSLGYNEYLPLLISKLI